MDLRQVAVLILLVALLVALLQMAPLLLEALLRARQVPLTAGLRARAQVPLQLVQGALPTVLQALWDLERAAVIAPLMG